MKITLHTIAEAAGVSRATASRALRHDPRISPATRERVEKEAVSLGWRFDPFVSRCLSQIRGSRSDAPVGTIAYLVLRTDRTEWRKDPYYTILFEGARSRAEQFNYRLELFTSDPHEQNLQRLAEILRTRGIKALLLAPLAERTIALDFPWSDFASAAIGHSLETPRLHRSSNHHVQDMRLLLERIEAKGLRRIGLALPRVLDDRLAHHWLGAYLARSFAVPEEQRVPALIFDHFVESDATAWLKAHQPDAVITCSAGDAGRFKALSSAIQLPLVPVTLNLLPDASGLAGMDQRTAQVGANAVDLVLNQIMRGESGIPESAKTVLCEGVWREAALLL